MNSWTDNDYLPSCQDSLFGVFQESGTIRPEAACERRAVSRAAARTPDVAALTGVETPPAAAEEPRPAPPDDTEDEAACLPP